MMDHITDLFSFLYFFVRSDLFVSRMVAMHPYPMRYLLCYQASTEHTDMSSGMITELLRVQWCSDMNRPWWSLSDFSSPCGLGVWNTLQHLGSSWILDQFSRFHPTFENLVKIIENVDDIKPNVVLTI
ncbi:hypothetical protein SEVIR_1G022800v4 [Setaria viridis]|uniref:Uncharacterized protein n=1 Tax=Setaria viridis TaxID=4556 RepID=A0A4U6W644_SETVI|nr:hypothetical protein SEVIR_1G022800v2 [Setaria viridis]